MSFLPPPPNAKIRKNTAANKQNSGSKISHICDLKATSFSPLQCKDTKAKQQSDMTTAATVRNIETHYSLFVTSEQGLDASA